MRRTIILAALALIYAAAVAAAQIAPDTVLQDSQLNPIRSDNVLITPSGGTQAKLSAALPPAGACTIYVTGGSRGPGNLYTASGAIAPSDFISILAGTSALAMTLGAGTANGHPLSISGSTNPPTVTSTVTLSLSGTPSTLTITSTTLDNLVWSASASTWMQC